MSETDPSRWEPIIPLLREFESFLSDKVARLRIVFACDRHWSEDEYKRRRPPGFPSNLRGVYLIFDPAEALRYVGVAMFNYDKRVWSHDAELERRWTDIIPFDDRHLFLALSFEFFLISRLKPPGNKVYRGYDVS